MKKRVVALLLAGLMVVGSLAGCGSSTEQTAADQSAPTAQEASTEEAAATAPGAGTNAGTVDEANMTETEKIIKEAEGMSMEELAAAEEQ